VSDAIEDWDLMSTNLGHVSDRAYAVAVLPVGAVEPHNRHLPYGQDVGHSTWIARECCRRAHQAGAAVVCLPPLPYGVDGNLMDFPLTMHVSQATLDAIVGELIVSCRHHGIDRFVILNGHGGNDFAPLIRQIQCERDVHVFGCDWWKVGSDRRDEIFDRPDDHAGQMETSVALALYPELVEIDSAGDGAARPFRFEALTEGWVHTSRRFAQLNDHCACGSPQGASAEKGRRYLEIVCERLSTFLRELAAAKVDEAFPHIP